MQLADIPSEILGQIGTVQRITFPRQGHTSTVAVLETADQRYVIKKTEHELYNEWLSDEHIAMQLLQGKGLPIPKTHSFCAEHQSRWLLMDYIEGISLRQFLASHPSQEDKERAITSFGRCLRKLHECPCPMEWQRKESAWLDTMLSKAEYNLAHYSIDGNEHLLTHLKKNRPSTVQPTLIHGDFTIDNVLVRDGEVVGMIDWAGAAYGDPRYDVALAIRPKTNAFEDERDKHIFYDAYGKRRLTEEEYRYFEDGIYNFF
ncbi:aminoglycoside phosphotransferase (APT) family kinase protein [Paenibacillus sp. 4624]|uniref:Phosphotransferase n=1 Tax=Paenibacillus amylolyticus TaxID=1451 RepID=A0A5M9WW40_PAEAM|nr:phosphotransferase [Paenibacillus amylolyticus]KAA8785897.1 phosphotransferase [Paenibacillus amylolyticus]